MTSKKKCQEKAHFLAWQSKSIVEEKNVINLQVKYATA